MKIIKQSHTTQATQVGVLTGLDLLKPKGCNTDVSHDPRCQTLKPWLQTQHATICHGCTLDWSEVSNDLHTSLWGPIKFHTSFIQFCQNLKLQEMLSVT